MGGLSGSPVFVEMGYREIEEIEPGGTEKVKRREAIFFLMGLLHGHFDEPAYKNDSVVADSKSGAVNMGIGLVIPAEKVLEVLNYPVLADQRDSRVRELVAKNSPVLDVAFYRFRFLRADSFSSSLSSSDFGTHTSLRITRSNSPDDAFGSAESRVTVGLRF